MNSADRRRLLHVVDSIDRIDTYCVGGRASFNEDPRTQDAVLYCITVIGEALVALTPGSYQLLASLPGLSTVGCRSPPFTGMSISTTSTPAAVARRANILRVGLPRPDSYSEIVRVETPDSLARRVWVSPARSRSSRTMLTAHNYRNTGAGSRPLCCSPSPDSICRWIRRVPLNSPSD